MSQAKNPCLVGLSGIVIHETENAFKVVTKQNKLKRACYLLTSSNTRSEPRLSVLPKQNSIFTFAVPLYSTLPSTHSADTPLPLPSPVDPIKEVPPEVRKTVLDDPHIQFELYGNQFRFRAAERAGRKFKHKETIEL